MSYLREVRIKKGLTLNRVSAITGISASDISMLERGLRPCYPSWRRRLAMALKVPAPELFNEKNQEEAGL